MGSQQSKTRVAAIIQINATPLQMLDRRVRFALARVGNDNRFRQPSRDVDPSIQASPVTRGAVIVRVGHRPRHVRHRVQERAIDGHGVLQ